MSERNSGAGSIAEDVLVEGRLKIDQRIDRAIVGSLRGQDLSGFEIWHWLGKTGAVEGLLTEAGLYPTLYRLEADGFLESEWQEAERIRRKYRLTATGLGIANANAWPAQVLRGPDAMEHPARVHSPDPDAGSWFVPPKEPKPEADAQTAGAGAPRTAEAGALRAVESDPSPTAPSRTAPGQTAGPADAGTAARPVDPPIAAFEAELRAAVDLPKVEANRVSQEIADHLTDSAHALEQSGVGRGEAVGEAVARLGDVHALAGDVGAAEHTERRWRRGLRRAVFEVVADLILWLALAAGLIIAAPGIADAVMALAGFAGIHLTVIRSAEWSTNQIAAVLCVGAFAAGRVSFGQLAQISRHRDDKLRRRWAPAGAFGVLVVALILPGVQDWYVVATLLAAPVAFALGTCRPKHLNETAYTWPGMIAGVAFVLGMMFLPGVRLFFIDLGGTPGVPAAPGAPTARIDIRPMSLSNAYTYSIVASDSGTYAVEFWPAETNGLSVIVDPAARAPIAGGTPTVDLSKLSWKGPLWVVAVKRLPDGRRVAGAVDIQSGIAPELGTTLGWMLGQL